MALVKQAVTFTFGKGVALKDAPYLIPLGKFQSLTNTVFDVLGQLTKRNGFGDLTSTLGSITYLTTFQNNLIGLGTNLQAYSSATNSFVAKGICPNIQLSVTPLSNALFGQSYADVAIGNGLICEVALNQASNPLVANWTILEQATGQILAGPTQIVSSGGVQSYAPKVFSVGSNFTILFDAQRNDASSSSFLEYITVPSSQPFQASGPFVVSSACTLLQYGSFDGVVMSTSALYVTWTGTPASQSVLSSLVNPILNTQSAIVAVSATNGIEFLSVTKDATQTPNTIWTGLGRVTDGFYKFVASTPTGSFLAQSTSQSPSPVVVNSSSYSITHITMTAQNGSMTAYMEAKNSYSYDDTIKTNLIFKTSMGQTGTSSAALATPVQVARGLGLASKAFLFNSTSYVTGLYTSPYQSTYFLINSSGQVQAKIAYGNAATSYYGFGLPNVPVVGSSAYLPYLIQNTVQSVGLGTSFTQQAQIYTPLGVNLAELNFRKRHVPTREIGQNLILGGGFLGAYDGQQFTENNFFLYPDSVQVTAAASGGNLTAQDYFYSSIYQWSDNKGNVFRSSPSIPVRVTCTTSSGLVAIRVPTLRTSYKNYPYGGSVTTPSQVTIYRWSVAQPIYYSAASAIQGSGSFNFDSTINFDTQSDLQLSGREILYTNGGVAEDVNGPATSAMTTFDDRLWTIDAEDKNLLLFSKQVIENTPVEMSDLFSFYVAPNVGAEGPTGQMYAVAPLDDKLILFKESALYYINGRGPDNTGANNQYGGPIFITTAAGSTNPSSIVLTPNGLMFQSNKGIWILKRDLGIEYIGKDVETLVNANIVRSAITIPKTNQVRFSLNTGVVLLYDYFVNEWGTFSGVPNVSSTLYNGLHTFSNSSSTIRQETPGVYKDGTLPVLMSFTTGWLGLAGLQGYQRSYKAYLLGTYYTPHNFTVGVGYDYAPSITQTITVNPTNTLGSGSQVEQWQLNFNNQQCQSFQLTFNEVSSQSAGQGLTLTGLNLVYGVKAPYPGSLGPKNQTS